MILAPSAVMRQSNPAARLMPPPTATLPRSLFPTSTNFHLKIHPVLRRSRAFAGPSTRPAVAAALPEELSLPLQLPQAGGDDDDAISEKERSRRVKISAANKGRVPWNKGRKMSEATREKIKQATREAMQRPEVRARLQHAMETRSPHSEATRIKIKAALHERLTERQAAVVEESLRVIAAMRESNNAAERAAAERADVFDVLRKAALQCSRIRREEMEGGSSGEAGGSMIARWERNDGGFRDAVLKRVERLERKEGAVGVRQSSGGGVQ